MKFPVWKHKSFAVPFTLAVLILSQTSTSYVLAQESPPPPPPAPSPAPSPGAGSTGGSGPIICGDMPINPGTPCPLPTPPVAPTPPASTQATTQESPTGSNPASITNPPAPAPTPSPAPARAPASPILSNPAADDTGVTPDPSTCKPYIYSFIHYGRRNNVKDVTELQNFLNQNIGANLTVNGIYDRATFNAVIKFQELHYDEILKPWHIKKGTGYVYLTTRRWINITNCPDLDIPIPRLGIH